MIAAQGNLFDPRTRRSDPVTSQRAGRKTQRFARGLARVVLEAVRQRPGMTASQITVALNPDAVDDDHRRLCQVRRRLSDLRASGLVDRRVQAGGDEAAWFPVICDADVAGRSR